MYYYSIDIIHQYGCEIHIILSKNNQSHKYTNLTYEEVQLFLSNLYLLINSDNNFTDIFTNIYKSDYYLQDIDKIIKYYLDNIYQKKRINYNNNKLKINNEYPSFIILYDYINNYRGSYWLRSLRFINYRLNTLELPQI